MLLSSEVILIAMLGSTIMPDSKNPELDWKSFLAIEAAKPENQLSPEALLLLNEAAARMDAYEYPNPMVVPWNQFPHLDRFSLGWRMGAGETYLTYFEDWFIALGDDERHKYKQINKEPADWSGYLDGLVQN